MKSKKIKTMNTRPKITDAEIHEMMDFNKLLDQHKKLGKTGSRTWMYGIVAGVIITTFIAWIAFTPGEKIKTPGNSSGKPAPLQPEEQKPVAEPAEQSNAERSSVQQPVTTTPSSATTSPITNPSVEEEPKADVYLEAEPLNGYPDLYAYFQEELTYPVDAMKDSVEGIVSISFVINREGKPENITIENSLGALFDNEAVRVIEGMPAWKPASLNGKPMPAKLSVPLTFQINREQK